MRIIILCFLALAAVVNAFPFENSEDGYNLDEILPNRRLLLPYIKCALETGKCSPGAKDLRRDVKKALTEDCKTCTEKQKKDSTRIFKHMINKENDYWKQIVKKYDPELKVAPQKEKEYTGKE